MTRSTNITEMEPSCSRTDEEPPSTGMEVIHPTDAAELDANLSAI